MRKNDPDSQSGSFFVNARKAIIYKAFWGRLLDKELGKHYNVIC